jgi:hypothetical protein
MFLLEVGGGVPAVAASVQPRVVHITKLRCFVHCDGCRVTIACTIENFMSRSALRNSSGGRHVLGIYWVGQLEQQCMSLAAE